MKKCIDKAAIGNILHKLWKKDTGYEYVDIARIAYNRALQDVQKAIDSKQEESVSEDKMTISKEWFEHCKKSWYNEGYIDGEYNRDRQFEEPVSEELEEAAKERVDAEDYDYVNEDGMPLYDSGYLEYMFKEGAKWQLAKIKSITLDDLGEFINELSKQFPEVSFAKVCKIATRTAKWLMLNSKLEED